MELIEGFKIALQSLWANKLRSILTLLGVVIGVASVITVVTLVNGAKQFVTTKLNSYGAEVVTVSKMPQTFITIEEYLAFQKRKDVKMEDYEAIRDECKSCLSVGALRNTTGKVVYGTKSSTDTDIRGWTWTMPPMSNLNIAQGRSFTEAEDVHSSHVAIVGYDVADNLLGQGDPLGKEIRVDGEPYTVIGVGERQGKTLGASQDNWVAVPLTAFLQSYGSNKSLVIYVNAGGGGPVIDRVSDDLRTIMRGRRHLAPGAPDTFSIDTSATFQNLLGQILNSFGAVVVAIAAISLVVGGIVIMNIMLVSVTERTREIGIRKALGARRHDIMVQFIVESATMSLFGGMIGVIGGITVAKVITLLVSFPSEVQLWSVLVGLFVATGVGVFFGVYPARKAAQLDPIVALRSEL
ncbi:Cell division protein FtsX [Acidisarcina polymorpha]|uniref:Cell division protein FtsX n=1 Tax=Acidisarcina polymorpha TaxID=2211140 RepID=A0A2Z5FVL7_9BACT|nr:ABC transporter permease [Acidisarcina polymorpha]AXC10544.1 Cell division protein FtsX [Acidisarcina polymorpha]